MSERRTVSVDEQPISYVVEGEGPPMLFVHGWPTHSGLYRNITPALAPHRRTVAIDLPGYGQSAKPTDVRYDFPFYSRAIDGVLRDLDIDQIGLVVHDLGGPVGLYWAVENPQRVRELVVLNTIAFTELHWAVKAFVAGISLPVLSQALTSSYGLRAAIRLGTQTAPEPEVLKLYTSPFRSREDRTALAKAGRDLSVKKLARTAEKLSTLAVPTLLLYGTNDKILPDVENTMNRLAAVWPHATQTPLAGVGHFLQEDASDTVSEHLVRFVTASA